MSIIKRLSIWYFSSVFDVIRNTMLQRIRTILIKKRPLYVTYAIRTQSSTTEKKATIRSSFMVSL